MYAYFLTHVSFCQFWFFFTSPSFCTFLLTGLISIFGRYPTDRISLYLDGVFTAKVYNTLTLIKHQYKLQAVQVEDRYHHYVSFLASSSNGVRTDESWRCTNVYYEGWFLPCYNDDSWPGVYVVKINTEYRFIAPDAKWIGYDKNSKKIYCRRKTFMGEEIFLARPCNT